MTLKQRIEAFTKVGQFIARHFNGQPAPEEKELHQGLGKVIEIAFQYNNWFIERFVHDAIKSIGAYLTDEALTEFTKEMRSVKPKTVAVICAGNIPLVGFHDIMCVLLSGHRVLIKMSSDDNILPPFFLRLLVHYEPAFEEHIFFAEGKLGKFDAVIATGSDNTASHFHYYFGKYPNIIRKSRTSVAVIKGNESAEDLRNLGEDVFRYFGLGCRNVSKLLVPDGYDFHQFFEAMLDYGFVINNKKYGNNYDYHRAIYLLESIPFLDNNFLMIRENKELHSPVGVLYYEPASGAEKVKQYLERNREHIQCVIGKDYIPFGYSQRPVITDFADNIDTLEFLVNL